MSIQILPDDFEDLARRAVQAFWQTRSSVGPGTQGGSRDAVVGGRNMDGFTDLVRRVAEHCGLPRTSVHVDRARVVLPGYFRATKNWDVLVVHDGQLVAVFEFKSQVGSFGNNLNNRSEEVIGSAADLWIAHHHGAFNLDGPKDPQQVLYVQEGPPLLNPVLQGDPRPPFLGWLMLLEDCPESQRPVGVAEPHFKVFPEFRNASYAQRYQVLCERMVNRQLYGAAALVLSTKDQGLATGAHRALSESTSLRGLFAEFAGRTAALLSR